MIRTIVPAAVALTLAACGQQGAAPSTASASGPAEPGAVMLGSTQDLPDWLLVARQRDCAADAPPAEQCPLGEVHFNQRTITRNTDGTADIWVQARHGQPQLYQIDTATARTSVRYTVERVHYRFNCSTQQFFVVERQIMGAGETVVAHDAPAAQIYRRPADGSVTAIVMPIACRGS